MSYNDEITAYLKNNLHALLNVPLFKKWICTNKGIWQR